MQNEVSVTQQGMHVDCCTTTDPHTGNAHVQAPKLIKKTLLYNIHTRYDGSMRQMNTAEEAKPTLKLRDRCSSSSKMAATFPHLQQLP